MGNNGSVTEWTYKKMMQVAPHACFIWDETGQVLFCNTAAVRLVGAESPEDLMENMERYLPMYQRNQEPSDQLFGKYMTKAFAEETVTFEWCFQDVYGNPVPVDITLVRLEMNEKMAAAAFVQDLRKEQELALQVKAAKEHATLTIKTNPIASMILNKDQEVVGCNEAALALFGWTIEEVTSKSFAQLCPSHQVNGLESDSFLLQLVEPMEIEEKKVTDWIFWSADGIRLWTKLTIVKFWDAHVEHVQLLLHIQEMRENDISVGTAIFISDRNRALIEYAPHAFTLWDADLNLFYCNQAAVALAKMPNKEEFIKRYTELFPEYQANGELSVDVYSRNLQTAREKGQEDFDWTYYDAEGGEIPVHEIIVKIPYMGGFIMGSYVSDLRKEQQLRQIAEFANERARLMLDSNPLACLLWDKEGTFEDCNEACLRLFKISTKEEFAADIFGFAPEYQHNAIQSKSYFNMSFSRALRGERLAVKWLIMDSEKEIVPCEALLLQVNNNGKTGVVVYLRDLREEIALQAASKEARVRNQIMVDATPNGFCLFDDNMEMIDCNLTEAKMYGMPSRKYFMENYEKTNIELQANGQTTKDFMREKIETIFREGSCVFEMLRRNMAGDIFHVQTNASIVVQDRKKWVAFFSRDITKEKTLLAELERSKDLAEENAKSKSTFLASMSHEIRTPMNAIIGITELLLAEELSSRQRNYVMDVKQASNNLLAIINDILDLSKIDTGKFSLNPVNYDIYAFLDNVTSLMFFLASGKSLQFIEDIQGGLPRYLYGDEARLRQVLINIIGNAVKFTKKGYVKISVLVNGNCIRYVVEDSGSGIKPESLPLIFNAFARGTEVDASGIVGTGLGLAITKNLVDMMGGRIWAESTYGKGSSFFVEIPIVQGSEELVANYEEEFQYINAPDASVLVVDDNDINLTVARGFLGLCEIQCDCASTGQKAIEMVQANEYDLVFMDHMMPEMDGIVATQRIRSLGKKYETLPIVALTANAVVGAMEMFMKHGLNDFVSKPIDKVKFMQVLTKWLPPEKVLEINIKQEALGEQNISNFLQKADRIKDLNVSAGLALFGKVESRYEESLKILIRIIPPTISRIATCLENEDLDRYAIEVHGLKGALGSIGAKGLSEIAKELELNAKNGDLLFCQKNTSIFLERLESLGISLQEADQNEVPMEKKQSGDREWFVQQLQKVYEYVDVFDGANALMILQEVEQFSFGGDRDSQIQQLLETVWGFDYLSALVLIEDMLKDV